MSDDTKSPHEETRGLNRRDFLGTSALTGAAALVDASTLGNAVVGHEARAAGKGEHSKAEIAPGELDEYYGFRSGGYFGEVYVLGVPSMCELMRTPMFNVDLTTGWGLISESKRILGDGARFLSNDCHYPYIPMTNSRYDGKYLLINDKANSRVVRIRLDVMKCDCTVTISNAQVIHDLRLQKVSYAHYVFYNVGFAIPHPNDGLTFDPSGDNTFTLYNAIDAETMEVAWQVTVDGNLDNTDVDCSGRFATSTCYNSEKVVDLGGTMCNERDWVVVLDIPRIGAKIKVKRFVTLGDSRVLVTDDRCEDGKDSPVTRYISIPESLHGLNTSSGGKYFIASGESPPVCTTIVIERLGDLFVNKLADSRDVVMGEPKLDLGPLHTAFGGRGNTCTTLFIDSQLVEWNPVDVVHAYEGKEVDHTRQKLDTQYQSGHNHATLCETSGVDNEWIVMLSKLSRDRLLPTGPLRSENDQLVDTSDEEMKLVHGGPASVELHNRILVCRDQIKTHRIWGRKDSFFVETVKRAEKDGTGLMKDDKVTCEGNRVRVYTVSMVPSLGLTGFKVKQGDEITVTIINPDEIEDVTHGFVMINHGVCMEISPQQTPSITFIVNKLGVYWYCCSWLCYVLHMEMCGRVLVEKA